jgi:acyl-CoA thioester hydrolase
MRHLTKAHVRWDDLDGFGHVNNATYLTYIQEARANFTWYSRKEAGLEPVFSDMVVGRAEVDFIVPIYEGGFDLDVAIWVAKIGNSSFDLVYELSSPLGLHARGRTVQVAVSMETKKSRQLSPEERDFLTGYLEA